MPDKTFSVRVQEDVVLGHVRVGDTPEEIRALLRDCERMDMAVVERVLEEELVTGQSP